MENTDENQSTPLYDRPVLVYDGECGFCGYWQRYWQRLTGDAVVYEPYQQAATRYPGIPVEKFQRAVQYITPDGRYASGAQASFLVLSHARGKRFWLTLYRKLPGFAALSEFAYAFIAARRSGFYSISKVLWGRELEPPRYDLVAGLFVRLFGLIYFSAFVSFGVQAQGLIGSHGILPLADWLNQISAHVGGVRFYLMPTVFWWSASDAAIQIVCWGGAVLSLLVAFNFLPRISLLLLHVLYLSLLYGGQAFMTYQWDTFLLEGGFLALILSFATEPGIWLVRWLLFRFMFMSGVVKLASGDANWWNLTALSYHFVTQPLPTPLAWYVAQLPPDVLKFFTGAVFFVELFLPFLIFCPRRLRFFAAFGFMGLEVIILLTGNYNWFNLQTMLLCLTLLDDKALRKLLPPRLTAYLQLRIRINEAGRIKSRLVGAAAALIVFCSLVQMDERFGGRPPLIAAAIDRAFEPLHIVGNYGLFAVMTTQRDEIVIEGSNDGANWKEYEFKYKPGDVARRPPWNIPHQPRLDWQMWFAALDDPRHLPWFPSFLRRLLENEPTVTALLANNPFPDKPPLYVRAKFYDYTWSSSPEKSRGIWWDRKALGLYYPLVHLKTAE